jgi:enoyl-[acyl-carrier-protein] reductase (NADH)
MGFGSYDALIEAFSSESAIKRPNTVEEVAAVAVLLASDAAKNITACMFPVDGGTMPY